VQAGKRDRPMSKNTITIKDIAKKLHLHHTTVSRALRYHPDVSEETKKRVHELAAKLDYHPNVIAQSFKKKKSRTIGIIVPDFKNDFFARLISGIEADAYEAGYDILICQSDERNDREKLKVGTLISNQVCGAVVCIAYNTQHGDHFRISKKFQSLNKKNNLILPEVRYQKLLSFSVLIY